VSNALQKQPMQATPEGQVVPINDSAALMAAVARAASDPNVDVEKMERLFAMHERMEAKQAEAAFNGAMSRVQASMRRIATDKTNSQTHSEYATYAALDRVLRPLYTAEGLSLSFDTEPAPENCVGMICYASHEGGHTRTYRAVVPSDGKGAKGNDVMTKTHAFGSGTAYGMRYLLKMIFNVAIGNDPDDDDGNGADVVLDDKAGDWMRVARGLQTPEDYDAQKKKLLADYGNKPENLPPTVRTAFNQAKARVMPKD
jgi:hypothetical protein